MERNVNYVFVGVLISILLIALTAFVIWLAGTHDSRKYDRYTVIFDSAVNGLELGGIVRYRGVGIGRIIDIRLDPENPALVRVDVEVESTAPVRAGTKGSLKPQGITGLSFIELETSKSDITPPTKEKGELYPVILARPSELDQLFHDAPEITGKIIILSEKLNTIATKIDGILSDDNIASIHKTLTNIETTTQRLNSILSEENTQNLTHILQDVDALTSSLAKNEDAIGRFSGEGLDEINLLVRDSRAMVNSIRDLAKTLEEKPSRILFQPSYDGVKVEP